MPNRNVRYGNRVVGMRGRSVADSIDIDNGEALTERQKDVLDAALRLLVEEGDR